MASRGRAYLRRTIRMRSIRRGLLGGSRFWLAVFVLGRARRWSNKVTKRGSMPVVARERLRLGEQLVIRHRSGEDVRGRDGVS